MYNQNKQTKIIPVQFPTTIVFRNCHILCGKIPLKIQTLVTLFLNSEISFVGKRESREAELLFSNTKQASNVFVINLELFAETIRLLCFPNLNLLVD